MSSSRFAAFDSVSWKQHQKEVDQGQDVVGFRFIEDNHGAASSAPASFSTRQIPFPDISRHPDQAELQRDLERMEAMSGKNTRGYILAKRNNRRARMRAAKIRQTELIGEFVAMRRMVKGGYRPLMPVLPGHGTGVDQIWQKKSRVFIVEAKGPGAKLTQSTGQMSDHWVMDRLKRQTRSKTVARQKAARAAFYAKRRNKLTKTTQTAVVKPNGTFRSSARFIPMG